MFVDDILCPQYASCRNHQPDDANSNVNETASDGQGSLYEPDLRVVKYGEGYPLFAGLEINDARAVIGKSPEPLKAE